MRKPGTVWERVKSDPEKLAARRLYQVLAKYRKDFPDDVNPPTTTAEVTARRFQNGVDRRRREREQLTNAETGPPPPPLTDGSAKAPNLSDADLADLLAECGF